MPAWRAIDLAHITSADRAVRIVLGRFSTAPSIVVSVPRRSPRCLRLATVCFGEHLRLGMRSRLTSLCVPGTRADRQEKSLGFPCDEVVLDLEDAVAAEHKDEARATVVRTLADPAWASRTVACASTPAASRTWRPWLEPPARGLTVLLPMVERPEQVVAVAELLTGTGIGLQALIETPAGSVAAHEIAVAEESLVALLIGYADLGAELGRRGASAIRGAGWCTKRGCWARSYRVQALDGPLLDVADEAGLRPARTVTSASTASGRYTRDSSR